MVRLNHAVHLIILPDINLENGLGLSMHSELLEFGSYREEVADLVLASHFEVLALLQELSLEAPLKTIDTFDLQFVELYGCFNRLKLSLERLDYSEHHDQLDETLAPSSLMVNSEALIDTFIFYLSQDVRLDEHKDFALVLLQLVSLLSCLGSLRASHTLDHAVREIHHTTFHRHLALSDALSVLR